MRIHRLLVSALPLPLILATACGSVSPDAPDASSPSPDAAAAVDAPMPDADLCPTFDAPAGSIELHSGLCDTALGNNPQQTPTLMVLPCPGTEPGPGTHGSILMPATAMQADGCPATTPVTRLVVPGVANALVQVSSPDELTIGVGDRFRVRVTCPAGVTCGAEFQITGSTPGGVQRIFPAAGNEIVDGTEVVNVDVEVPAGFVGEDHSINIIAFADGSGRTSSELLFENPHIIPAN